MLGLRVAPSTYDGIGRSCRGHNGRRCRSGLRTPSNRGGTFPVGQWQASLKATLALVLAAKTPEAAASAVVRAHPSFRSLYEHLQQAQADDGGSRKSKKRRKKEAARLAEELRAKLLEERAELVGAQRRRWRV